MSDPAAEVVRGLWRELGSVQAILTVTDCTEDVVRAALAAAVADLDAPPPVCGNCVFWSRHADASRLGDCSDNRFVVTGEDFGCAHFLSYPVA